VSAGEGAAERVTLTTDDATMPAVEDIAAILHAQGFVVERRVFVRAAAEEPRRVVLLALERPLPALVALAPPPAALPGLGAALAAALYSDGEAPARAAVATLQFKVLGAFASVTVGSGSELADALLLLAGRVRAVSWWTRPADGGERRIAYVGGAVVRRVTVAARPCGHLWTECGRQGAGTRRWGRRRRQGRRRDGRHGQRRGMRDSPRGIQAGVPTTARMPPIRL